MDQSFDFTEISEEEFYAGYTFSFGAMLDLKVLNLDFRTFCFMNPFTVAVDGERPGGASFEDLFRLTGNAEKEIHLKNLLEIRKKFAVSKRAHPIDQNIAAVLLKMSGGAGPVLVRQSKNFAAAYWKSDLAAFFAQDDWIACLPIPEGEFQIFGGGCSWLINARDDDFLNFLVVSNEQAGLMNDLPSGLLLPISGGG